MKKEIISYLEGIRNFNEGVILYDKYGYNRMLKAQFRRIGETEETKGMLFEELRKLAGMSEKEFKNIRRRANSIRPVERKDMVPVKDPFELRILKIAKVFGVSIDDLVSEDFYEKVLEVDENKERVEELEAKLDEVKDELEDVRSKYKEAPETVRKTIKFREQFPFLNNPDCPNELKILVSDMFTAYDQYKNAHAELVAAPDDLVNEELFRTVKTVVENYLDNREMWEELEYYKEHGTVLGKAAIFQELIEKKDLKAVPSLELTKKLTNAKANISKARKGVDTADDDEKKTKELRKLEKWTKTHDLIQAEIDSRKNG